MTLDLMPDVERLVIETLQGSLDVQALVGDRVYSDLPASPVWPSVRVARIGGSVSVRPYRLERVLVQVDCWGGPRRLTSRVAETCRAAAVQDLPGVHEVGGVGCVVTGVDAGGIVDTSDGEYAPARPLSRFSLTVFVRSADVGS